ncbi:MAG: lipopolysaccharide kinase InaA family protein, partial [Terrabacter sp.]
MTLEITTARPESALLDLPWSTPLEEWPESYLAALPRGISRHVVRFVKLAGSVYAVKETVEPIARHEYDLLFELGRRDVPCVDPVGIVAGRTTPDGEELPAAIITRHLQFSLPYRALFSTTLRPDTMNRLIDALAVLMVRLHLVGFAWGDCSLSNTLFRLDAGAFAAYLVDAETGEMHERLSNGQREYDLMTAETNVGGELLDVEASGRLHPS